MNSIRRAWALCRQELKKWKKDYKLYLILLLLLIFLLQYTDPLFTYADSIDYPVTPWLLPLVMAGSSGRLVVYGCEILFFSTLFNRQRIHQYEVLRCGHRAYLLGKNFYIFVAAFVYACMVELVLILPHLPQIYLTTGWGKLLGNYRAQPVLATLYISDYILSSHTAFSGMCTSLLLLWLTGCILGQSMFLLNSVRGKIYGTVFGGALVLADNMCSYIPAKQERAIYFSPLSWTNLDYLRVKGVVWTLAYPTMTYAFCMCIVLIVVLSVLMYVLLRISVRSGSRHQWFQIFG